MPVRSKTGLWLAAGMVACVVVGWGLRVHAPEASRVRSASTAKDATRTVRLPLGLDVVGRAQPIALDAAMARKAMRDGELRITLPDGTTYPVRMTRQETDRFGQWSVIGQVATPVGAQSAVLTFGGDAVFGMLPLPDGQTLRIVTNHGKVEASLAGGLIPPGRGISSDIAERPRDDLATLRAQALIARGALPKTPVLAAAAQRERVGGDVPGTQSDGTPALRAEAAAPTPVTITVLAAYADDLVALRGSDAAVQTELSNLVAAANQSHIDSGTRVRLSLVAKQKLAIAATDDNYDALYAMTAAPVGPIDTEALRDQYSADLVTFVRPHRDTYSDCGIAWVGGTGNYGTATQNLFAYSVVNTEPCGAHVMAHELGHNMGSAHDRETDWIDGEYPHASFPYAFGYRRLVAPKFATIMAYVAEGEPWIGRFSDPTSNGCGAPCGVANQSDNVRAFNAMAQSIADYRTAPGKLTISDSEGWEPDPDSGNSYIYIPVRINGFAPAAGVRYSLQIVGGTATKNVDYPGDGPFLTSGFVDAGYSESLFRFPLLPDTDVEGDETILLKITSPDGYPIADDTAVLTIRDDDPRPRLRGRFEQDPVSFWGTCDTNGTALGLNGPRDAGFDFNTKSNVCDFDLGVAPGANVELRQRAVVYFPYGAPDAYRFLPTVFNDVWHDRFALIPAPKNVVVYGQAQPAPGEQIAPNQVLTVKSVETWMGRTISEADWTTSGNYWYRSVYPGATLEMRVQLNAQYRPWYGVQQNIRQDTTWNAAMRMGGTIVVRGGQPWPEGRAGRTTSVPVEIAYVKGPDIGTIKVNWRTADVTAKGGTDYVAASGTVTLTNTAPSAIVWVDVIGNDVAQKPRTFDVVIDPVSPYNIPNASTRVTIADDDNRLGGPQPAQ
jgi:hypothetical protein